MAETVTFNAESRAQVGKGAARAIRRTGKVPAVIYGANKDPEPVTISPAQLRAALAQPGFFATLFDMDVEGNQQQVLCRELQVHPVTDVPMHLDFLRVTERTRINLEIQVNFTNEEESPGLKGGGVLNIVRREIEVRCSPLAIPQELVFDLDGLDIGASIHIQSIELPEGVEATTDRDFTVATVAAPTLMPVEEEDTSEGLLGEDGEPLEGEEGDRKSVV